MSTRSRAERWRRWSVAVLGAVAAIVVLGLAVHPSPELGGFHSLQLFIPLMLALALTGYGCWLAWSSFPPERIQRIAIWSLAGAVSIGVFAAFEMYIHMLEGEPFFGTVHELVFGMTQGAMAGGAIGYYDARRKDQYEEAELAEQAISASMDGIAVLDEDGRYETVNQAHAEVYGYEDPETFIGESWHMCYAEEEAARIEAEEMPRLFETGRWRGELTGKRRDGSTFPQELTLSLRPSGGLVCVVRDISQRKEQEQNLQTLHGVTREFLAADSPEQISNDVVSIADDMLGYPLIVIWKYDQATDRLVPLTATEQAQGFALDAGLEDIPSIETGSVEMAFFQDGEATLVDDYTTLENRHVSDIPLGAVLFIPLGDYGMVSIGSPDPGGIDDTDRFLAEILAGNARAAIDRLEREQELANREHRLRTIVENMPVILFTIDQDREITLQVGRGLDAVGVAQNEMVGTAVGDMFVDSPAILDAIDRCFTGESVDVTVDLWGRTYQVWYQPVETGGVVENVIGVAMDVTERQKREQGIRAIHDATRAMMQETDRTTICEIAVDTAEAALGLPISTILLEADDAERLDPVAWSDEAAALFGELPALEPGDGVTWEVFETGEPSVHDDITQVNNRYNPETRVRSELNVPIGEFGVLNSGTTTVGEFEETDVLLAQLLAANTRAALERADREARLQRQSDEMEFFNSILRHDVLNGMTVIRGRAQFLTDELEGDQLRDAQTIIDWSNDIVAIIQRVRKVLDTLTNTGEPQMEPVDLSSALRSEVERVQSTYPAVAFETEIPDGVRVQADDLLGEVFGNVLTNAVDHNDTDGLRIAITVDDPGDSDHTVTVRISDNGRGVPDERKRAIFRRDETGHAKSTGSGFGLFFVDSMVAEYGGDVRVEDNERGGAAFVFELPVA